MTSDYARAFSALKSVFAAYQDRLAVNADNEKEYTLVTQKPSPFPQHKGHPMFFGSVRLGRAYVSFHLMPIYMQPPLTREMSPELKKRMQGKTCFNFKSEPAPALISELARLTEAGFCSWKAKGWI